MSFEIRKFDAIPKIVGRGARPGAGKPALYPFAEMKEAGDGFQFPSVLAKKVRGAIQAYRLNYPRFKFAVREITPSTRDAAGVSQNDGTSAAILSQVLNDAELAAYQAEKNASAAAQANALGRMGSGVAGSLPNGTPSPALPNAVMASSVDDALSGLNL